MPAQQETVRLADRISRAAVWLTAEAVFVKFASILSQLLLARFLLSEDFGLYALAMTVYSFAAMMHQAGIQEVLIKRQKSFRIWANCAFWLCLLTGLLAALLTLAAAPLAARFYRSTRPEDLRHLITVLAAIFPVMAASGVNRARLQIEMRFRELAALGSFNVLLDLSLKVLLAWAGFGALSFGYAMLTSSIVYTLLCWYLAPVPVKISPQFRRWRFLLGDGVMVMSASYFYWLIEQGDYVVLGRFESEAVVGLYFFAYKISRHTMTVLTFQFSKVLFPALSRLRSGSSEQMQAFVRAARLVAVITMPICFCMAAVADPLIRLLFEPRWYAAIPLMQIMCLGMAMRSLSWPVTSLLQAQGRFRTRMKLAFISVIVFIPTTILGTWLGAAQGLSIAVGVFFSVFAVVDVMTALWPSGEAFRATQRIFGAPLIAGLFGILPVWLVAERGLAELSLAPLAKLFLHILVVPAIGAPVYALLIRLLAPDVWQDGQTRAARLIPRRSRQGVV